MPKNLAYYAENARSFFDNTVSVDMASLHEAFLSKLPLNASILDAGCGSGRDAKAFMQRGYVVTAFDASAPLAQLASEHSGLTVAVRSFADVTEISAYDGVWSCASLLHVPLVDLADALGKLWRSLRPGGCFYLSFKLGEGERVHDGRHFTDANDTTLRAWLVPLPELSSVQTWITEDVRPERPGKWINALVVRQVRHPAPVRKLVTGGNDPFLPHLSHAMAQATEVDIAVAFINATGMRLLMPDLNRPFRVHGAVDSVVAEWNECLAVPYRVITRVRRTNCTAHTRCLRHGRSKSRFPKRNPQRCRDCRRECWT